MHYRVGGADKAAVLHAAVDMMKLPEEVDREFLYQVLLAREALGSTGIGEGIAIPHVRNPIVLHLSRPMVMLCFLKHPVDFGALDGQPVSALFILISPTVRAHLYLLSRLGFALRDPEFKKAVLRQASREEIIEPLRRLENLHVGRRQARGQPPAPPSNRPTNRSRCRMWFDCMFACVILLGRQRRAGDFSCGGVPRRAKAGGGDGAGGSCSGIAAAFCGAAGWIGREHPPCAAPCRNCALHFRLDPLSAFFLVPICLLEPRGRSYGLRYWAPGSIRERRGGCNSATGF